MQEAENTLDYVVDAIAQSETTFLSPIGPVILAAAALDICSDSRGFARTFNVAHALVIRECVNLCEELQLIETHKRKEKTQSVYYTLNDQGWSLVPRDI